MPAPASTSPSSVCSVHSSTSAKANLYPGVRSRPSFCMPIVGRLFPNDLFRHTTFDEVRRLGLSESVEQEVREANGADLKGMLVVNKVTPQGPSYKFLEPGDVLYKINGSTVVDFDRLNTFVDDSVGNSLTYALRLFFSLSAEYSMCPDAESPLREEEKCSSFQWRCKICMVRSWIKKIIQSLDLLPCFEKQSRPPSL